MLLNNNLLFQPRFFLLFVILGLSGCYATTNLNNEELNYIPAQESISKGQDLYQDFCQDCHGSDLTGNGPSASTLDVKPANLREKSLHFTPTAIKGVMDYPHYSRETIQDKVKYGNSAMPPLKDILNKEEIKNLTDYISVEIRTEN
jgi:mono/diheme cytochrome c family protein